MEPQMDNQMSINNNISIFLYTSGVLGVLFAIFLYLIVRSIRIPNENESSLSQALLDTSEKNRKRLVEIYEAIREGADSFLFAEYKVCVYFIIVFSVILFFLTSRVNEEVCNKTGCSSQTKFDSQAGGLTTIAFIVGAVTSIISGYLGMTIAVFSNIRTTICAISDKSEESEKRAWKDSFNTAFRAGGVMGFSLCGLGLIVLYTLILLFNNSVNGNYKKLFECVAGFGLGGSSIALFGRVGGGIYTKAADVGADLAGKVVSGIPEDDPRNPATIADNVGDNVGDVAGMGSDLFGSFAEASCAALVISGSIFMDWKALMFPLTISAVGILVSLVTSFLATNISPVRKEKDIESVLKTQLAVTTILMVVILLPVTLLSIPEEFDINGKTAKNWDAWICVSSGLISGCIIGFVTEYFTSHSYRPTQEVAEACETGAATNIIYGLALGYKSAVIPVFLLAATIYITFSLLNLYGIALAALGMLGTLATCLSIDVYGPVCDNAGGIAEMAELDESVRDKTDALDAAGNTTAAIGKGFAIGSACLVGLALFGAFIERSDLKFEEVSILNPTTISFLMIGAMIPYWFSAMTMKSVGIAAKQMVNEVARQFKEIDGLLEGREGHAPPDHAACIRISTEASLREMVPPAILVISAPLLSGTFFGSKAVCGLLAGAISSSVQLAISASNTGGAWDNAKKYVEKGSLYLNGVQQLKGGDAHKAAVVGDTVGDPLKDTSGPALNIVMKLMAILSLVFADFFQSINEGKGLFN